MPAVAVLSGAAADLARHARFKLHSPTPLPAVHRPPSCALQTHPDAMAHMKTIAVLLLLAVAGAAAQKKGRVGAKAVEEAKPVYESVVDFLLDPTDKLNFTKLVDAALVRRSCGRRGCAMTVVMRADD